MPSRCIAPINTLNATLGYQVSRFHGKVHLCLLAFGLFIQQPTLRSVNPLAVKVCNLGNAVTLIDVLDSQPGEMIVPLSHLPRGLQNRSKPFPSCPPLPPSLSTKNTVLGINAHIIVK